VDGFPRTKVQVECIKMLKEKMLKLRQQFMDTPHGYHFRRPAFRVAVLFVDEKESVERQLKRGKEVIEHNKKVKEAGQGEEKEERPTDFSEEV
jgi:adenylate kinase